MITVLVNDIEIPQAQSGVNMTATGWYNVVTPGTRNGAFDPNFADASGNPLGDPYGSMAMMSVVVPNLISNGQSLPTIQVLLNGLQLEQFDASGTSLGESFTNNPAWVLLDVLRRSGWLTSEIDLTSFRVGGGVLRDGDRDDGSERESGFSATLRMQPGADGPAQRGRGRATEFATGRC